jgi:hypothetical protein
MTEHELIWFTVGLVTWLLLYLALEMARRRFGRQKSRAFDESVRRRLRERPVDWTARPWAKLSDEAKNNIRDRFHRQFGGFGGFHEMMILVTAQEIDRAYRDMLAGRSTAGRRKTEGR